MADTRQARENQAYVRRLLREKLPDFAAALELAVREPLWRVCGYRPCRIIPGATAYGIGGRAAALIWAGRWYRIRREGR